MYKRIVWIDPNVHSKESKENAEELKKQFGAKGLVFSGLVDILKEQTDDFILIVSGQVGENFISTFVKNPSIKQIIVFCGNVQWHSKWASKHPLISLVTN